ncbi:Uncharacterised protein [uncultured archaeon]|nr:Uncharacterised protein [uncultured archaeon]
MQKEVCYKCGISDANNEKFGVKLCSFCYAFAPEKIKEFQSYKEEKVDFHLIDTYRKNFSPNGERQKRGMSEKASLGKVMSRAPLGYKLVGGTLVLDKEKSLEVREIFDEFLSEEKPKLNHIAEKHNLSINGLKKVLKNFSYLGKVKFNNQIHQGEHSPIVSSTIFNHTQDKLRNLGIK